MHEAERLALPALDHAQLVARLERALGGWCLSGSASSLVDPGWARIISM
jgi:hypothetical protein